MNWYLWAIFGMLTSGLSSFVLRLAIEEGADTKIVRITMHSVVMLLSLSAVLVSGIDTNEESLSPILAVMQGLLFSMGVLFRMRAIKRNAPAYIVFSIFHFKIIPVILISVLFFDEWHLLLDIPRFVGMITAMISIYLVLDLGKAKIDLQRNMWQGAGLAFIGMLCAATVSVIAKYSLDSNPEINKFYFMLMVNMATLCSSLLITNWSGYKLTNILKPSLLFGSLMGVLNFIEFYAFLRAVSTGELSLIASISTAGILVPILLATLFLGEKLKKRVELAIFMSLAALILIG